MISLFGLVVFVALIVWVLSLLPIPAPFNQIILVVGILIVVMAFLQFAFNVDLVPYVRNINARP